MTTQRNQPPKPLTRQEVAELLGVSTRTVSRMLASGQLKRLAVSKRVVRISRASVDRLLRD